MNVLSLFDGMSCGQQALNRLGIKVDNYFASEIDKYAITVTMANYPNTKQLGSVVDVDGYSLPKIDLLIGGSPCQSFSFAGKRKGMSTKDEQEILTLDHYLQLKSEGYEFEGQSYLFWEYMRLLNEVKPKYFLLENVMMGEKWEKVLSKAIGVNPIMINSSLVSAQNRQRLYWTNIGMQPSGLFGDMESIIKQPKDRGILLKDILQDNPNAKYHVSEKLIAKINRTNNGDKCFTTGDKSLCLAAGYYKQGRDNQYITEQVDEKYYLSEKMLKNLRITNETNNIIGHSGSGGQKGIIHNPEGQSSSLCATDYKQAKQIIVNNKEIIGLTEVRTEEAKKIRRETGTNPKKVKELAERKDDKTGALLTSPTNDNLIKEVIAGDYRVDDGVRWRENGKSPTLMARAREDLFGPPLVNTFRIRRLTPIECERLQTVPDNYTNYVSDSQRYKMLGNGWTVDVIAHIFSNLKNEL